MQGYVFGNVIRELYNFQLEEKDYSNGKCPPSKIIVFIDELNKFASKDSPKDSPILRQIRYRKRPFFRCNTVCCKNSLRVPSITEFQATVQHLHMAY